MIVEFSVKNFRSIKELQTISFVATKLDSNQEKFPDVDKNNIVTDGKMNLLKVIGIYGANASGKSNIIRALDYFVGAIRNEPSQESKLSTLCDPFLYQDHAVITETFFQVVLVLKNKKYRYGFTVKANPDFNQKNEGSTPQSKEIITSEWLHGTKGTYTGEFFRREGKEVNKEKLQNSDKIPALPYDHSLFLTHAAAFDSNGICASIRFFLRGMIASNYGLGLDQYRGTSLLFIKNHEEKGKFLQLFSSFGLNYTNISIDEDKEAQKAPVFPQNKINLTKQYVNTLGNSVDVVLNLFNNESSGTQKLFDLAGILLVAFSLPEAPLIILDEMDSNFHPSLLLKLIGVFNDPNVNKSKAQLLFTSHDTNLMTPSILRRDQFYLTEKDNCDATRLFSLAELKGIRNDADFARHYLAGFYGALPLLHNYSDTNINQDDRALESKE